MHLRDKDALFVLNLPEVLDFLSLKEVQDDRRDREHNEARKRKVAQETEPACIRAIRTGRFVRGPNIPCKL
jgi:hypothetical protein